MTRRAGMGCTAAIGALLYVQAGAVAAAAVWDEVAAVDPELARSGRTAVVMILASALWPLFVLAAFCRSLRRR